MRVVLLSLAFCLMALPARPAGLVADLSHHLVAITTAFAGSDVLVFGTVDAPGRQVIVTVRGPSEETVVQQKSRVGFLWLSTAYVTFRGVPEFYAIAATDDLATIADPEELARNQIGAAFLDMPAVAIEGVGDRRVYQFRDALVRRKQAAGLFQKEIRPIGFIGDRLFRTTLSFPADVPPGNYQVRVFELDQGVVVAAQTSSLTVSKVGLEAELFDLAHGRAAFYGVASVAMAVAAGWTASIVFKKN